MGRQAASFHYRRRSRTSCVHVICSYICLADQDAAPGHLVGVSPPATKNCPVSNKRTKGNAIFLSQAAEWKSWAGAVRLSGWSGCSRGFLFILIKYKGMGSGRFNNKRTDFVWGDRQPAFITGGTPGLHVYMSYDVSYTNLTMPPNILV